MSEAERPIRKRARAKLPKKTGQNAVMTRDPILAELFKQTISKGMTLDVVAARLGMHLNTISKWKVGKAFPNSVNLQNFAEVVGYRLKLEQIR